MLSTSMGMELSQFISKVQAFQLCGYRLRCSSFVPNAKLVDDQINNPGLVGILLNNSE